MLYEGVWWNIYLQGNIVSEPNLAWSMMLYCRNMFCNRHIGQNCYSRSPALTSICCLGGLGARSGGGGGEALVVAWHTRACCDCLWCGRRQNDQAGGLPDRGSRGACKQLKMQACPGRLVTPHACMAVTAAQCCCSESGTSLYCLPWKDWLRLGRSRLRRNEDGSCIDARK